ncbi:HNH endonuclease family protein [Allonocardiopsis opalescens]|uniref:Uncharacterized protein DUF1524 n=1 Tax=Allonocardiopsis opalescens TaxID=1144618 RepID=A0A2T0QEQ6_9ACTN|nr:HNH endonuclease family protein [Allonocardiopsis opalescens]PRY02333.1 uncharacterized protein DUF1524 [Allonocardiopsis opalescens]
MRRTAAVAGAVLAGAAAWAVPLAAPAAAAETIPLHQAVERVPEAAEDRTGYDRDQFRHWIDADRDGCSTRAEVLIDEAVTPPEISGRCTVGTGEWFSYYDGETWTAPLDLDIDHMVPLAEAWDSGASQWTAAQRRDYANDLGDERALVAVTDNVNQGKADQDPAEWLPPVEEVRCRYLTEWVAVKLRWGLTADQAERMALAAQAARCPNDLLSYEPAV